MLSLKTKAWQNKKRENIKVKRRASQSLLCEKRGKKKLNLHHKTEVIVVEEGKKKARKSNATL